MMINGDAIMPDNGSILSNGTRQMWNPRKMKREMKSYRNEYDHDHYHDKDWDLKNLKKAWRYIDESD